MTTAVPSTSLGKRKRDPLAPLTREVKVRRVTENKNWIINGKARDDSVATYKSNVEKSLKGVAARLAYEIVDEQNENVNNVNVPNLVIAVEKRKLSPQQSHERKIAIKYAYENIYGSIAEDR